MLRSALCLHGAPHLSRAVCLPEAVYLFRSHELPFKHSEYAHVIFHFTSEVSYHHMHDASSMWYIRRGPAGIHSRGWLRIASSTGLENV